MNIVFFCTDLDKFLFTSPVTADFHKHIYFPCANNKLKHICGIQKYWYTDKAVWSSYRGKLVCRTWTGCKGGQNLKLKGLPMQPDKTCSYIQQGCMNHTRWQRSMELLASAIQLYIQFTESVVLSVCKLTSGNKNAHHEK